MIPDGLITAAEMAKRLGVEPRALTRRVRKGSLISDGFTPYKRQHLFFLHREGELRRLVEEHPRGYRKPAKRKKPRKVSVPKEESRDYTIGKSPLPPLTDPMRVIVVRAWREGTLGPTSQWLHNDPPQEWQRLAEMADEARAA